MAALAPSGFAPVPQEGTSWASASRGCSRPCWLPGIRPPSMDSDSPTLLMAYVGEAARALASTRRTSWSGPPTTAGTT